MAKLFEILDQAWRLREQRREIRELRDEVEKLHGQNERMRTAMRRCITCEFRIEVEGREPPAAKQKTFAEKSDGAAPAARG